MKAAFIIRKILREPLLYLLLLLAIAYFHLIVASAPLNISDVKVTRNNTVENIELPYNVGMAAGEVFHVSFNLLTKNKYLKFNVITDDCLQELSINGKNVSLDGIRGLCDYVKGAHFDFSEYLQEGLNHFELRIKNNGGPGGLRIERWEYNGFKSLSLMHYVFALLFLLSAALVLRKLKFKFIAIFVILLGITIRLIVYTYTAPMNSPFDIPDHIRYVTIVAEEKRLPNRKECFECFQPPLYYVASAAVKNIVDSYDHNLTNRILQQVQLLLSFASVVFGIALIISLLGNSRVAYLAALTAALWPGFVISAPRIGNEIPFYFGALFCMFFVQRYWYSNKNSDMLLASIGASIALAAKSTGFVILGAWIAVYILKAACTLKAGSLRVLFASVLIIALFAGFSNYRSIVDVFESKKAELAAPFNSINGGLKVKNTLGSYLYFDLRDYLLLPYTSGWQDEGGRQYFWNYLLKSSLYLYNDIKLWNSPVGNVLATMLCLFALLVFVLALWGMIHVKFKELPAFLFVIFLFAALIGFRAMYPYACHNEMRFIFPVLFPLAYFSVRGVQILENSRLRKLSYLSLFSFAVLSFIFIAGVAI